MGITGNNDQPKFNDRVNADTPIALDCLFNYLGSISLCFLVAGAESVAVMSKFVIPKTILVRGTQMIIYDLDISDGLPGSWEARAEYQPIVSGERPTGGLTLRFNSEERFNELLALAGGEVLE